MSGHVREELGAYVLGALDPADRREVEVHLSACAACRDELARLSGLPSLLDRLSPDEAMADLTAVPAALAPGLGRGIVETSASLRRAVRRWRVATAAASLVAVAALGLALPGGDDATFEPVVVALRPVAVDAGGTEGTVAAYDWEWGTTVEVEVDGLPERGRYVLWTVAADGERTVSGTWGPTTARSALVRGASAVARDRLLRVEVRDADGQLLLAAELPASGDDPDPGPTGDSST